MKNFLLQLKGWRTMLFAWAVTLLGVLTTFMSNDTVKAWLDANPKAATSIVTVIGLATAFLRAITTTPVGTKPDSPAEPKA